MDQFDDLSVSLLIIIGSLFYWVLLCVFVGMAGKNRMIRFWKALLVSFFFSPLLGLAFVALSPRKPEAVHRYRIHFENGQREEFKGNYALAIDEYKNALFYLRVDYHDLSAELEADRQRRYMEIKNKIQSLGGSLPH